jgi:phenylalanyl-tRNA synthetase alpha chain
VRVVLRHPTRSLAKAEANALRNAIYAALHEGSEWEWAMPPLRAPSPPSRRRSGSR